jgi:hypothetical protein
MPPTFERNFKGAIHYAHWLICNGWYDPNDRVTPCDELLKWFKNKVQKHRNKEILVCRRRELFNTSVCIEYDDSYEILLPADASFNHCHQKFAVCKELCHILTDDGKYKSHQPFEQLTKALEVSDEVKDFSKDPELVHLLTSTHLESSEDFCFLLAMEILIPLDRRDEIIRQVKVDGTKKIFDVAQELRLPQTVVKFFVESDYHATFKRIGGDKLSKGSIPQTWSV